MDTKFIYIKDAVSENGLSYKNLKTTSPLNEFVIV